MCSSTVAQLVEQLPHNQEVVGSNPRGWKKDEVIKKTISTVYFFSFFRFSPMTSPVSRGTETTCKRCKKDKFLLASRLAIRGLLGLPALEIVIGISLSNPRFAWLDCY